MSGSNACLCLCLCLCVCLCDSGFFMRMCSNSHKPNKKYCNCTQATTAAVTTTIAIAKAVDAAAVKIRIKWQCKCQRQKHCYFTVNELCACVRLWNVYIFYTCGERKEKNYYIRYLRKNHDNIAGISYFNDVEYTSARHREHINSVQIQYCATQMEMQRTRDTRAPDIKMMSTHKNCSYFLGCTKTRIAFCVRLILYIYQTVCFWSSIRIHFYLFSLI